MSVEGVDALLASDSGGHQSRSPPAPAGRAGRLDPLDTETVPVPIQRPRPGTVTDGMHALRHFYASTLLAGGVSIKEVAGYLGHADPGFTLRTYTHLVPSSHAPARQVSTASWARGRARTPTA